MTKSKILVILIICLITLQSCEDKYLENMFEIQGFEIDCIDSNRIELHFNVFYYSDSTIVNNFAALEKGTKGSNSKIIFMGFVDTLCQKERYVFSDFVSKFNSKSRFYKGQYIDRSFEFELNELCSVCQDSSIVIIKRNINTNNLDTIYNSVMQYYPQIPRE